MRKKGNKIIASIELVMRIKVIYSDFFLRTHPRPPRAALPLLSSITGHLTPAGPCALTGHLEGLGLEAEEPLAVGLALRRQLRTREREVEVAAEVFAVETDPVPLRAESLGLGQDAGQSHDVA